MVEVELRWRQDARRIEVERGGKPRRGNVDGVRRDEERRGVLKREVEVVESVRKMRGEGCWRVERSAEDPMEDRTEVDELDDGGPTEHWTNVLAKVEGDAMAGRRGGGG